MICAILRSFVKTNWESFVLEISSETMLNEQDVIHFNWSTCDWLIAYNGRYNQHRGSIQIKCWKSLAPACLCSVLWCV